MLILEAYQHISEREMIMWEYASLERYWDVCFVLIKKKTHCFFKFVALSSHHIRHSGSLPLYPKRDQ